MPRSLDRNDEGEPSRPTEDPSGSARATDHLYGADDNPLICRAGSLRSAEGGAVRLPGDGCDGLSTSVGAPLDAERAWPLVIMWVSSP